MNNLNKKNESITINESNFEFEKLLFENEKLLFENEKLRFENEKIKLKEKEQKLNVKIKNKNKSEKQPKEKDVLNNTINNEKIVIKREGLLVLNNLREKRKLLGVNAKLLAKVSDLSPATISLIENNLHKPSQKTIRSIASGFNKIKSSKLFT